MFENLQSVNVFSPSVHEIFLNIIVSLACSFAISLIYRFTYRGPGYSESFVNSIVFLSIITALVLMIIGNNIARAFSLVGALSIIRFRTAIKDTVDIVYIFLSLAIGMAAGVGYHKLAIVGTIMIGFILLIFSYSKLSVFLSNQYMLQFNCPNNGTDVNPVVEILSSYCKSFEIVNIKSIDIDDTFEYSYYIRVKKSKNPNQLIHDLQNISGIRNINLFFDQQNS